MMPPVQSTVSPPKPQRPAPRPTAGRGGESHWVDALADVMERVVPDAITTSIILLVVLFGLSLSLGSGLTATIDAYYRGLWMLLQFTMQMTLILVLSLILGATPDVQERGDLPVAPAADAGAGHGARGRWRAASSRT